MVISNIKDFKDVKKARVYLTHLEAILKVVNLSMAGLKHFEVYSPVKEILQTMRTEKQVLEKHLTSMEKIIKDKSDK